MFNLNGHIINRASISDFLFLFGSVFIIPSFVYAKALITISIIAFVLSALLDTSTRRSLLFFRQPAFSLFPLVFLGVIVSGINSVDTSTWIEACIIKLPFLVLPFAFWAKRPNRSNLIIPMHLWLLTTLVISAIPQYFFYLQHHASLLEGLGRGQPIPVPVEHVKYSMINAYGVVSAVYFILFHHDKVARYRWYILIGISILVVFMHLLAVRTGLVIIYVSLFSLGIAYAIRNGKRSLWILIIAGSILTPIIAYQTMPTIKQKANYMMYDWKMYQSGQGENYADSQRWLMISAGIDIWQDNLLMGIGYGDLKTESVNYYRQQLKINDLNKLPHNQFLITLAGSGLIGLIIFLIGFYGPLVLYKGEHRLLLSLLYVNFSLSFLVENSLERSVSVGFFLFFALLIIRTRYIRSTTHD